MATITIDHSGLMDTLRRLDEDTADVLLAGLSTVTDAMEADAKRDAPWTDRTGNARRTMTGFVTRADENTLLIGIAGHMPYSPDLEARHGLRYAILVPTVDRYAPTILQTVTKAVLAQGGLYIE